VKRLRQAMPRRCKRYGPSPRNRRLAPRRQASAAPDGREPPRRREPPERDPQQRHLGRRNDRQARGARRAQHRGLRREPLAHRASGRSAAPMRGWSRKCCNRARRAPCGPLKSAAPCSATRAWRWRSPRSATRSANSKAATPPSRSPTARPGAIPAARPPRGQGLDRTAGVPPACARDGRGPQPGHAAATCRGR
jgi:hypothetical protein